MVAADTSLLTRLVERQRGRQPSLSPVLSSRFEPPVNDLEVFGAGLEELEERVPAPQAEPRGGRAPNNAQPEEAVNPAEAPVLVAPAAAAAELTDPGTVEVTGRDESVARTSRPTAPDERVVVRPGVPERDAPSTEPPPPLLEVSAESGPSERSGTPSTDGARTHRERVDTRLPEPLVGPARRRPPDAAGTSVEPPVERVVAPGHRHQPTRPEAARPPAEQPLTVSVRIGRIEVRAPARPAEVPTADATRRNRPEPRVSLEDYLARPNRGWS